MYKITCQLEHCSLYGLAKHFRFNKRKIAHFFKIRHNKIKNYNIEEYDTSTT